MTDFGEDAAEVMPERTSPVARTRRVVSAAIAVFAISIAMSLAAYVWDWVDALANRDGFETDEWLSIIGVAWLPVVAGMVVRLVRLNRTLADTATDALGAYHDTVRTAYGWLWQVDSTYRITYSSAGVQPILGYEPSDVVGRHAIDLLIMDEDREAVQAQIAASAGTGWQHWRTPVRHRDGSVRWQVGLGPELELHAVALACRHLPRLPGDMYLSVNLSPRTILDPRLTELVDTLGPAAARTVVEVTEHAVIDDYDAVVVAIRRLARSGVRLAVDDAGAGYASMLHVLRLRPDIIRLDRSMVTDAHRDPARRALLGAMGSFADSLGVVTVAEGVETADDLAVLVSAGIISAQGYHIARPGLEPMLEWSDAARPAGTTGRPTELVGP